MLSNSKHKRRTVTSSAHSDARCPHSVPVHHCPHPSPRAHSVHFPTVVSPVHVTLCIQSANSAETFTPHTALAGGITNASEKLQARKNFINFHLYDNGKFNFPCIASDTFGVHSTLLSSYRSLSISLSLGLSLVCWRAKRGNGKDNGWRNAEMLMAIRTHTHTLTHTLPH